jgi:hypothetical protein
MITETGDFQEIWRTGVAPALHLSTDASFSIAPGEAGAEGVFVHTAEGDFVLRVYRRGGSSRSRNHRRANRAFSHLHVVVPRIMGWGKKGDCYWLVESRIEGTPYRELLDCPEAIELAAATLAEIHRHERRRYGEIGTWGGVRLTLRWRQRFLERWSKIVRLFPELKPVTGEVERWFSDWADSFSPRRYQLLHGDYRPENLIQTREGRVALFGFRTPRFGVGLLETIEAAHHLGGEEPSDWEPFLASYLRERDARTRDLYAKCGRSLHAVFHLRHADRTAGLAFGDSGTAETRRTMERHAFDSWTRFCNLAGITSPSVDIRSETAFPLR